MSAPQSEPRNSRSASHNPRSSFLDRARISLAVPLAASVAALAVCVRNQYQIMWDDGYFMMTSPFWHFAPLDALWSVVKGEYNENWAYTPVFRAAYFFDIVLFRKNPHLSHLLNLVLHLANVALVWQVARLLLTRSTSLSVRQVLLAAGLAATLFGIHPVNVEPVAWVSGRKVELALLFSLTAFLALLSRRGRRLRYGLAVVCYGLALLSNATALGMCLVFGAWWAIVKRAEFLKALALTLPFLCLALWSGTTRSTSDRLQIQDADDPEVSNLTAPLGAHFSARARETLNLVCPRGLVPAYPVAKPPFWTAGSFAGVLLMAGSAFLIVLGWVRGGAPAPREDEAGRAKGERSPPIAFGSLPALLAFGLAWYWLVLGPAFLHHRIQTDRHLYISAIGLFIAFGVLSALLFERLRGRAKWIAAAAYCAAGLSLSIAAARQASHWFNAKTLFGHTVAVGKGSYIAHTNYGYGLAMAGDIDGAAAQYRAGGVTDPKEVAAEFHNHAVFLWRNGVSQTAIESFRLALKFDPDDSGARNNLGAALSALGRNDEAEQLFLETIRLDPNSSEAHHNLGVVLVARSEIARAIEEFRKAVEIDPNYADAHDKLGDQLWSVGALDEATRAYEQALSVLESRGDRDGAEFARRKIEALNKERGAQE